MASDALAFSLPVPPRLTATASPGDHRQLLRCTSTSDGSAAFANLCAGATCSALAIATRWSRWRHDASRQPIKRALRSRLVRRAEASGSAPAATATDDDMHSPFEESDSKESSGDKDSKEKPKLPLTPENVEIVLDELRPYLQSDGGDCRVVDIDGSIVRLELQGACSSCSASSVTLKMGIEKTLMERIPEVSEVVSVMPELEPLNDAGVEEVLNGIRPFLSVSGGTIEIHEIDAGSEPPQVTLKMTGPPLKSMAVRVEVKNRMKRKYPQLQDVEIVAGEGEPTTSA
mmetsp:Transcript_63823/g.152222  ORF Transcript_63823/g.152222 Transcript_63823/m.152222 type:complete len:287 (+) Transcript_63823:80-940(+)